MAKKTRDSGYVQVPLKQPETPDYVVVELTYTSQVAPTARGFAASTQGEKSAQSLNRVLEGFGISKLRPHFGLQTAELRQRVVAAPSSMEGSVSADFAQAGFVQVVPERGKDARALAQRLNRQGSVWKAFVAPRPVPAAMNFGATAGTRSFEAAQGYLGSAPEGIGAMEVWSQKGGRGEGVTVCDIEGNWNRTHQDLPQGIKLLGGTVINDVGWRNHGTAVLGEIVSRPGDAGCIGIAHKARAVVHSALIGGVFNAAQAIRNSARKLKKGDVILIELHGTGLRGRFVAMQYWLDVFSAIRDAGARGITVVEAAGNGDENFDLPIFKDTGLQKHSGAIVVGAAVPPTNQHDYFGRSPFGPGDPGTRYTTIGAPRSRIWFSNYGKIVDVQAWGWHVATLGYGDAQGGASQNGWYTLHFSGTSSASPIVTGAVACIQGRAKAKRGKPLTPARVRRLLMQTGTQQQAGPGVPRSQRIGPQPNLSKALRRI
jgi:subtilisin family serine protease